MKVEDGLSDWAGVYPSTERRNAIPARMSPESIEAIQDFVDGLGYQDHAGT